LWKSNLIFIDHLIGEKGMRDIQKLIRVKIDIPKGKPLKQEETSFWSQKGFPPNQEMVKIGMYSQNTYDCTQNSGN
jgi:hypothetical protein